MEEIIFPNQIRMYRRLRGRSMQELADHLNVSLSAISKIEKGYRRVDQEQLVRIAEFLDCPLQELFVNEQNSQQEIVLAWRREQERRNKINEKSGLKTLGAGLRQIRNEKNLTLIEVAESADMTLSVYHRIEMGQREVSDNEFKNIAKALKMAPEELRDEIKSLDSKGMLEEIIDEGHRILLFSQFVDMLDIIKAWLEREGIPYEYLTGKTKDRQAAVENFNNNPNIPIFLVSLKAGGTGLNLTGADYVIHYDPWWNPAVEDQATDRAYRIGQTKKVFVYRLITKNTVEEKIQKIKGRKRDLVDSVVSIDRNITKSLTMEDIKDIFSVD